MSCKVYTKNGNPCPFESKTFSKEADKNVCNIHSKTCKDRYKEYKNICSKIWNSKCKIRDDPIFLKRTIKFAQQCKDQRIEFTGECCDNNRDNGHTGAVIKMSKIIDKCEEYLEEIENDEKEGWTKV